MDVLRNNIQELVMELHPSWPKTRQVLPDSSLSRDLGLDSLARVELLTRIENFFNVTLEENKFIEAETPRELWQIIINAGPSLKYVPATEIKSPGMGETYDLPHSARTLVDALNWHVEHHPDRPHIRLYSDEDDGETITYRELADGARAAAAGLQEKGLLPGEAVSIMLPTSREYFLTFLGILLAGGIPVPIYPPFRMNQLEDHLRRHSAILNNCGAKIMVIIPEAKRFAQVLKAQVESMHTLVTFPELTAGKTAYVNFIPAMNDIAFLQYTSGSTGNPKGVVLTHANLLANVRALGEVVQIKSTDVIISWLPLYHDMGLIGTWLSSLYFAALLVVMSPLSFISRPQRWLWAIHRYRGTISAAPNFAYELCLKRLTENDLQGLDLSSWRIACNGAEPVSPETVENFCRQFGRYGFKRTTLMPVYGLAECSVGLAFPPLDRGPLVDRIDRDVLSIPAVPFCPQNLMKMFCVLSPAVIPFPIMKCALSMPPVWNCRNAARANFISADLRQPAAIITMKKKQKNFLTATGWIPETWLTSRAAIYLSPAARKTSSSVRAETSTRRNWKKPSARLQASGKAMLWCLPRWIKSIKQRSWW